jgi:hypothetical protein
MNEVCHWQRPWKSNFLFLVPLGGANLELILTQMIQEKGVLQRWYKAVSPLLKVIMELVVI